ncbi:diaminopimelate epimerase [Prochlorococcus marinus]|uniref:Diaminopimelate epimerase n=1 Tax=Prochlorococcus marinus XMU1408 TaxID=2213228 RepID=A0A318R0N4_PROMR|nr:diaminopimelate epimerase [Prochlorococcus marinus]MBW3041951.1 diaminopimelate epimerase [Prochlorococcus marinus str. XMU1408]PYE03077.1 diaminopimelate epimerase [Prochlorococcus marinus XMU1408]
MKNNFSKYQGIGNDFIIFDARGNKIDNLFSENKDNLIEHLCNRNFGIGADGIILILESNNNCFARMRIFNSDGSEPEMCGNGIRCLISFLNDNNEITDKSEIRIETKAGKILTSIDANENIKVNMGEPILSPEDIPTKLLKNNLKVPNGRITINDQILNVYAASMGNPHMVIFVNKIEDIPFQEYGRYLEKHNTFPNDTNVHFVELIDKANIKVKVWERGCGPTLACGTGACACLVVASMIGKTLNNANVYLPGGKLVIEWPNQSGPVFMQGPAIKVFSGVIDI